MLNIFEWLMQDAQVVRAHIALASLLFAALAALYVVFVAPGGECQTLKDCILSTKV